MADNIPKRTEEVEFTASAIAAWVRSIPDAWMREWGSKSREEIATQIEGLSWAFGPIIHIDTETSPQYPDCGCSDGTEPDEPSDRGFICPHDPRGHAFSTDVDEEIAANWIGKMTGARRLDQANYENLADLIRQVRLETISLCIAEISGVDSREAIDRLNKLSYPEE